MKTTRKMRRLAYLMGKALQEKGHEVPRSILLHALAAIRGSKDWHVLSAVEAKNPAPAKKPVPARSATASNIRGALESCMDMLRELLRTSADNDQADAIDQVLIHAEQAIHTVDADPSAIENLRTTATAFLHAFGGDVPDWIRIEADALGDALEALRAEPAYASTGLTAVDRYVAGPDDYWGEDARFPREDWVAAVANDDTRLGYWEWVAARREEESGDSDDCPHCANSEETCGREACAERARKVAARADELEEIDASTRHRRVEEFCRRVADVQFHSSTAAPVNFRRWRVWLLGTGSTFTDNPEELHNRVRIFCSMVTSVLWHDDGDPQPWMQGDVWKTWLGGADDGLRFNVPPGLLEAAQAFADDYDDTGCQWCGVVSQECYERLKNEVEYRSDEPFTPLYLAAREAADWYDPAGCDGCGVVEEDVIQALAFVCAFSRTLHQRS